MTATEQKRPWDLQNYVSDEIQSECRTNAADHRTTSRSAIERIESDADRHYAAGVEFMKTVSREEIGQCLAYFRAMKAKNYWALPEQLAESVIGGKRMLVPLYMRWIEEVRMLRAMLKPLSSENPSHG